jgi:hypothetical protein
MEAIPKVFLRTPYVLYGKHLHISKSEQGVAVAIYFKGKGV